MPEIPEIAYYKNSVSKILHKKIVDVEFGETKVLQSSKNDFKKALQDHQLTETWQIGKYLFIKSGSGKWLVFHFGMTGKLEYSGKSEKHMVLSVSFSDDSKLSFVCPRKFGKVYLTDSVDSFKEAHSLGDDALDLSKKEFRNLLKDKRGGIKSVLMNQHVIAGIGNLYADEILFHSKVHPKSIIAKLTDDELNLIYKNISKILKKATESYINDTALPKSWLRSHRKDGADCPDCKGNIKQITVSGRSTYFCPNCQKEKT